MSEARQRRASAVAKLKRAASLPRMQDGRRPAMPRDAATQSDPERPPGEEESPDTSAAGHGDENGSPYLYEVTSEDPTIRMGGQDEDTWTSAQTNLGRYAENSMDTEFDLENQTSCSASQTPLTPTTPVMVPTPTKAKRRSRSRSRSRGSKDLRKRMQSPTLGSNTDYSGGAEDSSADERPTWLQSPAMPYIPIGTSPFNSPVPSRMATPALAQLVGVSPSPGPSSSRAISPFFFSPYSPQATSGVPSLEAIQGLYRSKSTTERKAAYSKLTGETSEDGMFEDEMAQAKASIKPSHSLRIGAEVQQSMNGGAALQRAATVAGGDRINARRNLLATLQRKNTADASVTSPGEPPSAGEETPTATPSPNGRRRRRRSKRQSAGAGGNLDNGEPTAIVDDREPLSPTVASSKLPPNMDFPPQPGSPSPYAQEYEDEFGGETLKPRRPMASTDPYSQFFGTPIPISNDSPKVTAAAPLHFSSASGSPAPPPRSPVPVAPLRSPLLPSRSPLMTTPSHSPAVTPASRSAAGTPNLATMQPYRGIVVEDEDDTADLAVQFPPHKDGSGPSLNGLGLPRSPLSRPVIQRVPHSSEAPSMASGHTIPVYLSESTSKSPSPTRFGHDEPFPTSPFHTPLKESTASRSGRTETEEEDEEPGSYFQQSSAVASSSRGRSPYLEESEKKRELSWVEQPQIPVHYEDDDEEEVEDSWGQEEREEEVDQVYDANDDAQEVPDVTTEAEPEGEHEHETYASSSSHRRSYDSKEAAGDMETSPDIGPSYGPPSPSSAVALYNQAETPASNPSSRSVSVDSPYDDPVPVRGPEPLVLSRSRSNLGSDYESGRTDGFISPRRDGSAGPTSAWEKAKNMFRAGSNSGRRSRTNSVSKANVNDSSRESAGSEGLHNWSRSHSPAGIHSPTMSTTYLSSTPQPLHRGPPSPLPGPSPATAARYTDAKLFPLPGLFQPEDLRRLDEQRKRGQLYSPSSPDLLMSPSTSGGTVNSETTVGRPQQDNGLRERQIVRQPSNPSLVSPGGYVAARDRNRSPSPPPSAMKDRFALPTNRKAAVEWVRNMRPTTSKPSSPGSMSPGLALPEPYLSKKPSLSDILRAREVESIEWEDSTAERTHTPLSAKVTPMQRTISLDQPPKVSAPVFHRPMPPQVSPGPASPPSLTPDAMSSPEADIPSRSTSQSSSASFGEPSPFGRMRGGIMKSFDDMLRPGHGDARFNLAVDDPPRKLLLASQVLQVCNANTVKDRFLFLFSDLLVIAKPIVTSDESLTGLSKPSPQDRKFIIKSAAQLRNLRLKDDPRIRPKSDTRHPIIRSFILQFSRNPDQAISMLLGKTEVPPDARSLGELLFSIADLNRAQVGRYVSQKSTRLVLKAYLDSFHFEGIRLDKALRAFLCSVHVHDRNLVDGGDLEFIVDAFASRWHQANPTVYDKYLAMRLARAIVFLNGHLHGGTAQDPGSSGHNRHYFPVGQFIQAFRQKDQKRGVSDKDLSELYASVSSERLSQAADPAKTKVDMISIKRTLPLRLTHRQQSEPIVIRLPQADPLVTIHLHGHDLVFDPPVLSFAKSSDASFRVTGTALGQKWMIMYRAGLNAPRYSGLPLSCPLTIERDFMRHTFEIAFTNHINVKRRYNFSVDDPLTRDGFIQMIHRQQDLLPTPSTAFEQAAETLAYRVLAEQLLDSPSSSDGAFRKQGPSPQSSWSANASGSSVSNFFAPGRETLKEKRLRHQRSQSRSDIYYTSGPGKYESGVDEDIPEEPYGRGSLPESPSFEGRLWDGADVELLCRQSSAIPVVLSHLKWGSSDGIGSRVQSPTYRSNRI